MSLTRHNFGPEGDVFLSVLIPFYKDNAANLLAALMKQVRPDCEILIYDDGTGERALQDALIAVAKPANCPVTLLFEDVNKGRSAARNALREAARADWVLFLDADMLPLDENFIARYLEAIKDDQSDVIFGGFTVEKTQDKDTALHAAFSAGSDCLTAAQRTAKGAQYVCSSNLCVRKSVLIAQPFDTGFQGWGWEDSEWAARVTRDYRLLHIENPALHLGLERTQTLLTRFATSAANYDRFTARHPELAQTLTLFKLMRLLARIPGQALIRPLLKLTVQTSLAPMRLRLLALKLWRASHYAQHCTSAKQSRASKDSREVLS